jgi:predicted MFS family arabinose efflux permease
MINFLGAVAGTLGTGTIILVETFGWGPMMLAASALMLFAAVPAIIRKEPPPPAAARAREERGERPNLWAAIKRRDSFYILPFLFWFGFGAAFFPVMTGPFLADKGLTLTEFGIFGTIVGVASRFLTALVTPWIISRIGSAKTAMVAISIVPLEACVWVFWALNDLPPLALLITTVSLMAFGTALYEYAVTISRFRWVSKAQAGTDYAMQSSFWNFGDWAARSVAGVVVAYLGWAMFFPIAAAIAIAGALFYIVKFEQIELLVQEREAGELKQADGEAA